MNLETYLLPAFWASALINSDESGMTDSDVEELDGWLEENNPGYCVGCSDADPEFSPFHDAGQYVLACDCIEFTFDKGTK